LTFRFFFKVVARLQNATLDEDCLFTPFFDVEGGLDELHPTEDH